MQYQALDALHAVIASGDLTSLFQPVVDLRRGTVYGYEALVRGPADSPLHSPVALFDCAGRHGLTLALDGACWSVTSTSFAARNGQGKLFVNVSPASLEDPEFRDQIVELACRRPQLPGRRVVVEITEQYPLENYERVAGTIQMFRDLGVEVAIDDLGAGYSGLRAWSELRPHYVKIDRHFIAGLDADPVKREFVNFIRRMARELNCRVVAEGIETAAELAAVQALDIDFGQGYYLGRPKPEPEAPGDVSFRVVPTGRAGDAGVSSPCVGTMALMGRTVDGSTPLETAADLFQSDRKLSSLPVLDGDQVIGAVRRQQILELMAARFSRELHGKKPVTQFMDPQPICVDHDAGLDVASRLLTNDADTDLTQDFIVLKNGRYFGIGKTSTLLRRITEQQLHHARYANPLTMLPGNPAIHEQLNAVLNQAEQVRVAYIDLNHFKPYNDYYGYDAGDRVIIDLAKRIRSAIDPDRDFIGHVGGDDFIVVFRSEDWEKRCRTLLDEFAAAAPGFYDAEAVARGGIESHNRRGEPEFFGFVSIAVGIVWPDPVHCASGHDVARLASEAKVQAKSAGGNSMFVSRRRRPNVAA